MTNTTEIFSPDLKHGAGDFGLTQIAKFLPAKVPKDHSLCHSMGFLDEFFAQAQYALVDLDRAIVPRTYALLEVYCENIHFRLGGAMFLGQADDGLKAIIAEMKEDLASHVARITNADFVVRRSRPGSAIELVRTKARTAERYVAEGMRWLTANGFGRHSSGHSQVLGYLNVLSTLLYYMSLEELKDHHEWR